MPIKKGVPVSRRSNRSFARVFVWIVAIVAIISIAGKIFFLKTYYRQSASTTYRAIFLDNGEVYFGHVQNSRGAYLYLSDVYYLKVSSVEATSSAQPDIQLMKLGNELHQPQNHIYLNRDHILFIEDLSSDSHILSLIENFDQIKNTAASSSASTSETLPEIPNSTTTPTE